MDLETMTTTTAGAAAQEATLLAAKPSVTPEASEKDTVAGKNGSAADSTDGTGKDKALAGAQLEKVNDASSPAKKFTEVGATPPNTTTVPKSVESHKKVVDSKSPAKQLSDTTGGSAHEVKSAEKTPAEGRGSGESVAPQAEGDLEHYDELVQRLEAIEKGEDPALVKVTKKADDASHQNGMVDNVPGKLPVESQSKKQPLPTEKDASVRGNSAFVGSTVSKSDAKPAEEDLTMASGGTVPPKQETASSSVKRKLSECTPKVNEPDTKKVHIGDVIDSTGRKTTVTVDTEQKVTVGSLSAPVSESSSGDVPMEKPPSVEKMDVDASPEPETSCCENVDTLPDTEPNTETEGEEKTEEISSSVADQSTRKGDDEMLESNSNVSSSDDKRTGATESVGQPKPPDSEVSASALPTPSEVEAMDVDMEADVDEGDLPSGPIGPPVVEPPCVKKVAYLCYDDEHPDGKTAPKPEPSSGKSTPVASTSTKTPTNIPSAVAPSMSANEGKMEVDSVPKSTSRKPATLQAEAVVDSSIAAEALEPVVATSKKSIASSAISTAKVLGENVVESSQPSSSSDSKKQASDKGVDEQLRATVHRSALLAKASSTPNTGTTGSPAATPSMNPSTPNPVIASAVSSSNVFSSTPIHKNFEHKPVNSGNVSKITNPSSVETSRIEADDATEHSSMAVNAVTTGEGNDTTGVATASTTKSLSASGGTPSNTETASPSTEAASTSTSPSARLTPPKKDPLLKHEHSSSGTSLKTTDSSEVDSCTVTSEMNTAEEIAMYANNARKYNGISSTSSDVSELGAAKAEVLKTPVVTMKQEEESNSALSSSPVTKVDLVSAIRPTTSHQQQYEVSIWFEGRDLQFLSIEKLGNQANSTTPVGDSPMHAASIGNDVSGTDGSLKQSTTSTTSNGSVTSLGPFALPDKRLTASTVSSNSSSGSVAASLITHQSSVKPNVPQVKQTVIGPSALCDLMIGEFKKLKRTFAPHGVDDDGRSLDAQLEKTPKTPTSSRGQRKDALSGKKSASRAQKRAEKMADGSDEEDTDTDLFTLKASSGSPATKQATKRSKGTPESPGVSSSHAAATKTSVIPEPKQFDICCLARWTDRKYYAGRVTNQRGDKYVVMFEDGCSKTLARDVIVFGEDGVLPILNHSIHVLTGGDTYEPAIVEEVKRNDSSNEVVYAVRTASSTLEIAASGIYLTDEQAKWIHNACKNKPDPIQQLLLQSGAADAGDDGEGATTGGGAARGAGTATDQAGGDKGSRSTRSKRGFDKTITPGTPEAGYSGGVGKKGRRGRRNKLPPPGSNISECSEGSDTYEDEQSVPQSPEAGLDAVDGVQPELQRTEQESELVKINLIAEYFGADYDEENAAQLLGAIPYSAKTLFRNKHFLLSCTIPPKSVYNNADNYELNRATFSSAPFVKQHLRRQIEAGGGKVYNFFEDVPKNKYKNCKLIAPRPSTTALYIQCLACNIVAVSHEWIAQCCHEQTLLDHKNYTLPSGWSFLEQRYMPWGAGRTQNKRSTPTPLSSTSINVASLNKDFNDFWSRVCRLGGATVRLIKRESDVTETLSGYLLTDQEFPEEIKIKASRIGLLVVSTVWVVQCLINGRICHPSSHEKLTQIYQEDDY